MKSSADWYKAATLALMLGVGVSATARADDYSTGGGGNLPVGEAAFDKRPVSDTSDLTSDARCGPLADDDPFWQPRPDRAAAQEASSATSAPLTASPPALFQSGPPNPVF